MFVARGLSVSTEVYLVREGQPITVHLGVVPTGSKFKMDRSAVFLVLLVQTLKKSFIYLFSYNVEYILVCDAGMDKNPANDDLCLLELKVSPIFRSLEVVKLHQIPKVLLFSRTLWAHASHSIIPPPRLQKVVAGCFSALPFRCRHR
jgi:hypothetical protein